VDPLLPDKEHPLHREVLRSDDHLLLDPKETLQLWLSKARDENSIFTAMVLHDTPVRYKNWKGHLVEVMNFDPSFYTVVGGEAVNLQGGCMLVCQLRTMNSLAKGDTVEVMITSFVVPEAGGWSHKSGHFKYKCHIEVKLAVEDEDSSLKLFLGGEP